MRTILKSQSTPLEPHACEQLAELLGQTLADTYILYIKTQNFHWNIIDPRFQFLHEMLEEQYKQLAEEIDELAERIRMLKLRSPGSMQQFLGLGSLEESANDLPGNEMIRQLMHDHDAMANHIRPKIEEATKLGDQGTADLFISHLRSHEKTTWMLRSHFIDER
jgi:starvation-inducible DNA-binding protein